VGVAQLAGDVGGNQGDVVVRGLLLHLLRLGDAGGFGGLGLPCWEGNRVEMALVGTRKAPVLTRGLLPGEAGAHGAILHRNLGGFGWSIRILGGPGLLHLGLDGIRARQVLGDKLVVGEIVVSCDASQETGGVLLEGGSEDNTERVHLFVACLVTLGSTRVTYVVFVHVFTYDFMLPISRRSGRYFIIINRAVRFSASRAVRFSASRTFRFSINS